MVKQPLDARLQMLLPVVRGLAEMLGPDCEVVLHDLAQMPHSIVAIENGHVTGRRPGDAPTDQMLRSLRKQTTRPTCACTSPPPTARCSSRWR